MIYALFSVIGIEIEYMIVDKKTLVVKPITDQVLTSYENELKNEVHRGIVGISNELAKHVIEIKNFEPARDLKRFHKDAQEELRHINEWLNAQGLMLLPSGMHPLMDPHKDTVLWDHGNQEIYDTYNKVFDCSGHGWGNLQSTHINLPFANNNEFIKLHSAIRLLLPIIPALTASTPLAEGKSTGHMDTRLLHYKHNQKKIPEITGDLIPEFVKSESEYIEMILRPMYKAISEYDPEMLLQNEWLNSRGAIARFERNAIEIRIIDTQECLGGDIAVAEFIKAVLEFIVESTSEYIQNPMDCKALKSIYDKTITHGFKSMITQRDYLEQLELESDDPMSVKDVWEHLFKKAKSKLRSEDAKHIQFILKNGSLAERIMHALNNDFSKSNIIQTYQKLGECLAKDTPFK